MVIPPFSIPNIAIRTFVLFYILILLFILVGVNKNNAQKNHPRVERGVFLMRAKPLLLAGRVKRVSGTANRVTH